MYLAGLSTFLDSPHYQTLLLASSAFTLVYFGAPIPSALKNAEKTAGKIKKEPRIARICTTIHGPGTFGTRALLLGLSAFNIFFEREVLAGLSLPDHPAKRQIQLFAIFADLFAAYLARSVIKTIGNNFAAFGTREKSSVVTSGPFKYVRHAMYDRFFLAAISNVLVFWN